MTTTRRKPPAKKALPKKASARPPKPSSQEEARDLIRMAASGQTEHPVTLTGVAAPAGGEDTGPPAQTEGAPARAVQPRFNQADFIFDDLTAQIAELSKQLAIQRSEIRQRDLFLAANAELLGLKVVDGPAPHGADGHQH